MSRALRLWPLLTGVHRYEKIVSTRNRGQRNQSYINRAMDALPPSAPFAFRKMAFVVAAHLRRQAGNVIPPARQNLPYNRINALLTHK